MFKKIIFGILAATLLVVLPVTGDVSGNGTAHQKSTDKEQPPFTYCPKYSTMRNEFTCFECHIRNRKFQVKESFPDSKYEYPIGNMKFIGDTSCLLLENINSDAFYSFLRYSVDIHGKNKIVVEIESPGGGLFEAWRIINFMTEYKLRGVNFETRVLGYAMSAGFLVFLGGNERVVFPGTTFMWHELLTFALFKVDTPSSKEDEAGIMRALQKTIHKFVLTVSNITIEELDEKVKRKEWWLNGEEALKYKFATKMIKY